MLEVTEVNKFYGEKESRFQVLKNVSLKIQKGDFVVILGASGSGKSTLLNVMSGLEQPDGGHIYYDDTDITLLSDKKLTEFRKQKTGFIFQQYYLLPAMNVLQNVKLGADLAKNKNYTEYLEAVGLKEKMYKYPNELSGGEQQRVSVARALAKKPEILFLDEPTGALDEATGRQVLNYIDELHRQYGFTVIMVTHNQNIADMAKTVIRMNSGKIAETYVNENPKDAYGIGW